MHRVPLPTHYPAFTPNPGHMLKLARVTISEDVSRVALLHSGDRTILEGAAARSGESLPRRAIPDPALTNGDVAAARSSVRRIRKLLHCGRSSEAFALLEQLEWTTPDVPPDHGSWLAVQSNRLRAIGALLRDDPVTALHHAERLLRERHMTRRWRTEAAVICRFAYWRLGDAEGYRRVSGSAPEAMVDSARVLSSALALCIEAAHELEELRFPVAKRLALQALALTERAKHPAGALPSVIIARILYEQGFLDEAESLIRARLPQLHVLGLLDGLSCAYLLLARIAVSQKRLPQALSLLQEADGIGQQRGWVRLSGMSLCEQAHLHLRDARMREARHSAERLDRLIGEHRGRGRSLDVDLTLFGRITNARMAFASAPGSCGLKPLRKLHDDAIGSRNFYTGARLAVELVGWLEQCGEYDEAERMLARTARLGCFAGLYQVFCDGGDRVRDVLCRLYTRGEARDEGCAGLVPYFGSVLALHASQQRKPPSHESAICPPSRLSARESDVLDLICRGLSNKRIALALEITPETVKSHIKRIFAKLGVRTRAEAASRAGSLGMLRV